MKNLCTQTSQYLFDFATPRPKTKKSIEIEQIYIPKVWLTNPNNNIGN